VTKTENTGVAPAANGATTIDVFGADRHCPVLGFVWHKVMLTDSDGTPVKVETVTEEIASPLSAASTANAADPMVEKGTVRMPSPLAVAVST
jgi:hypothetical protein